MIIPLSDRFRRVNFLQQTILSVSATIPSKLRLQCCSKTYCKLVQDRRHSARAAAPSGPTSLFENVDQYSPSANASMLLESILLFS